MVPVRRIVFSSPAFGTKNGLHIFFSTTLRVTFFVSYTRNIILYCVLFLPNRLVYYCSFETQDFKKQNFCRTISWLSFDIEIRASSDVLLIFVNFRKWYPKLIMGDIVTVKHNDELYPQIVALRQRIFRNAQKKTYTPEELENDKHILYFAYINDGELIGVVGLENHSSEKAQLRQMGVHDKIQGKGIGRKLVEFLEEHARNLGLREIYLDSRCTACRFYARLGYNEYGTIYNKGGIPHIHMKKFL
jgi:predicted GNAT family N-acyltransferase